jgi:NAD(P)-dependent dehydrogenase (short-subunit alcohol dehydrogenase family)
MRLPLTIRAAAVVLGCAAALRLASRYLYNRRLDGKTVFITGGSRGLGLAIALECAKRGAKVVICGRDADRLASAAEKLRRAGSEPLTLTCDVRDRDDVNAAIGHAVQRFGGIDIFVNNAGTIAVGPFDAMTREDFEESIDTHFWAMYNAVEAVRQTMERQGGGRIVNITSIGGKVSVPHLLPYSVGKFAAVGYSEGLRAALRPRNITVTTVCPGLMRTGSPRNAWFKSQNEKEYTWFALSDALPGLSIAASSAARSIVDASMRGDAEIVLSLPAQFLTAVHGVFPGFTSNLLQIGSRLLPSFGGVETGRRRGRESETRFTQSPLTALSRKAERDYNQI